MKKLGFIASGLGVLVLLVSFGMDTAPEGTHNIGLMQEQMMFLALGCLLSLAGVIMSAVSHALSRMEDAGLLPPADVNAGRAPAPHTKQGGEA